LRALDRRHLLAGHDLALVGWDDGPLAELSRPPIAVVDRDPRGLGSAAASLALGRLGHNGARDIAAAHVVINPARFIPRASCMPVGDPRDRLGGQEIFPFERGSAHG